MKRVRKPKAAKMPPPGEAKAPRERLTERLSYPDVSAFMHALDTHPATPGCGADLEARIESRYSDGGEFGRRWQGGYGSAALVRAAAESGVSKKVRAVAAPASAATLAPGTSARVQYAIAGGSVSVPRMLEGRPDCMRRIVRAPRPQRVARVRVNFGANCNVSAAALEARGLEVLAAVAAVERQGVMTEVTVGWRSDAWGCGSSAQCTMTLKRPGQPLDWQKAAFWMADPAALRVFGFQCFNRCISEALRERLGHSLGHATRLDADPTVALDLHPPISDAECYAARAEKFVEALLTAVR